jgi:uncharacterized protein (DUF2236 family)
MILTAYERYNRPLSPEQRDRYLTEQAVIGRMGGADSVPETMAELREHVEEMRPKLAVNAQTQEFFEFLLTAPFGPPLPERLDRGLHRFAAHAGMSLAPRWARDLSGFSHSPAMQRALVEPYLRFEARSLRWAFGTPAHVAMARERAAGASSPGGDGEPPPSAAAALAGTAR